MNTNPKVIIDLIIDLGGTDQQERDHLCRLLQDKYGAPGSQWERIERDITNRMNQ